MFTVVKKVETDPESGEERVTELRLVLDERLENLRWEDPPWVGMSSPTIFGYLEVVPELGHRFRSARGDIPNFYYTVDAGEALSDFFGIPLSRVGCRVERPLWRGAARLCAGRCRPRWRTAASAELPSGPLFCATSPLFSAGPR